MMLEKGRDGKNFPISKGLRRKKVGVKAWF